MLMLSLQKRLAHFDDINNFQFFFFVFLSKKRKREKEKKNKENLTTIVYACVLIFVFFEIVCNSNY